MTTSGVDEGLTVDSPAINPESPLDQDDIPYPCMGCGEV